MVPSPAIAICAILAQGASAYMPYAIAPLTTAMKSPTPMARAARAPSRELAARNAATGKTITLSDHSIASTDTVKGRGAGPRCAGGCARCARLARGATGAEGRETRGAGGRGGSGGLGGWNTGEAGGAGPGRGTGAGG